jgi:hypothetical protein
MLTWLWFVIVVAAALVAAAIVWAAAKSRRTKGLQGRFGPEYDRVAADAPSRREAEAELRERERRRDELDIRPLDPEARERYRARWQEVQARFVDDPEGSVAAADSMIQNVMRERGYPVEDFDTRAADLSVDHSDVVENYRAGHAIAVAHDRGKAGTDDLRTAIRHYRVLFAELVEPDEAKV